MARIVYLHQYFNTREGHGGTRSYEFARRLAERGHDVQLVTSDRAVQGRGGPRWRVEKIAGFSVHWLKEPYSNSMSLTRRAWAFLRFAIRASWRARSLQGEIIFATSTPLTIIIPALVAKFGRRVPIVFEVRDLWPEMPIAVGAIKRPPAVWLSRELEKLAYRSAVEIVALSEGMKAGVVAAGISPERVTVIPNASDIDLFSATPEATATFWVRHPELQGREIVAYAGTLGRLNGVGYIVDVASELLELSPTIAFVIVGSGAEERQIRDRAEAAGVLGVNVFLWSRIPKTEVVELFAAAAAVASLFVPIKAMEANSANKFFDGLAAGRPILINYGGWHRELIEEHRAGLYLDPARPNDAARVLAEFMVDKRLRTEFGLNSRRLARSHFDRDNLAATFINVLERSLYRAGGLATPDAPEPGR